MRTLFFTLLTLNSLSLLTHAQINNWCATDSINSAEILNNPLAKHNQQQFANFVENYIKNNPPNGFRSNKTASSIIQYVIPVVFHIIHNNGPENISDAQIYDEMQTLKINYQGLRTDTAAVYSTFKPLIADVQIEFRLAHIDPNGNCTNGIDRIVSPLTNNADDNSKLNPWPYNKYLNIWTINTWNPAIGNPGAYAYLPGVAPQGKDGIIALHSLIGSIGTATPANKWVITHEAAHWLGVPHTWGVSNTAGTTCGDDGITDTPITKGFTFCPQPVNAAICTPGIVENYQNYMDYSPCKYMFTNGQKARMWATLNSAVSMRDQIPTQSNLLATGTDGNVYVCPPVASFNNSTRKYICEGASVFLQDFSQNLDSTGNIFTWFSNGAFPNTATGKQASLTFPNAGVFDVSLTVTNAVGSDTFIASSYVWVSSNFPGQAPFTEGFETITLPGASDWFIENQSTGSASFETTSTTSYSGSHCLTLNNFSGGASDSVDVLITSPFSLLNTTAAKAFFRIAYANTTVGSTDLLRAYVSNNCGATWTLRYSKNASMLATVSTLINSNFTPLPGTIDTSEWRQDFLNLSSYSNQDNLRIKFEFKYGSGNNLFIDDINISGIVGLENIYIDKTELELLPNPSNGNTSIKFKILKSSDVALTITSLLGEEIQTTKLSTLNPGNYNLPLKINASQGIYFIRILAGEQSVNKKLTIY